MRRLAAGRALFVFLAASFASSCATTPVAPGRAPSMLLAEADGELLRGNASAARLAYDQAIRSAVARRDARSELLATLGRAECLQRAGDPSGARLDAARCAARAAADSSLAPEARRDIECRALRLQGDLALDEDDVAGARGRYQDALTRADRLEARDGLLFRLYVCARRLGNEQEASNLNRQVRDPGRADLAALRARHLDGKVAAPSAVAAAPAGRSAAPAPALGKIQILPRARWAASPIKSNRDPMGRIRRVTVHHSDTQFTSTDLTAAAHHIKGIQRYHQADRGWADIGYHFVIDPAGRVWEGRPLVYQGAHAGNATLNAGNIGIVLLGDFLQQPLPDKQQAALLALLDECCRKYGISRGQVLTHKEIRSGTSECPGWRVTQVVNRFRDRGAGSVSAAP